MVQVWYTGTACVCAVGSGVSCSCW